jgi:hypothetical protein
MKILSRILLAIGALTPTKAAYLVYGLALRAGGWKPHGGKWKKTVYNNRWGGSTTEVYSFERAVLMLGREYVKKRPA